MIPFNSADKRCRQEYYSQEDLKKASMIHTDFDFGDDRLEVTWSRILKKIYENNGFEK